MIYVILTICFSSLLGWFFSDNRKNINWYKVLFSYLLQIVFAIALLKITLITKLLLKINPFFDLINNSTIKAVKVAFGELANPPLESGLGFILAFQALPSLIVISALCAVLNYLRILPILTKFISIFLKKTLRIGGALSTALSLNIFTGMTGTPIVMKPYLKSFTKSEFFALITATVASSSIVQISLYNSILLPMKLEVVSHIISAIIIGIPGSIAISRIIVPETKPLTEETEITLKVSKNIFELVSVAIQDAAKVIFSTIIMLIGFIALIELFNSILISFFGIWGIEISIAKILGLIFSPLAWIIGIDSKDLINVGTLLGSKIVFNEIVAFNQLAEIFRELKPKTINMMLYALSGFVNFGSMGIIIGVYNSLIPERQKETIAICGKAFLCGILVNLTSAAIAGMLFDFKF